MHLLAIALNRLLGGSAPALDFVRQMAAQPLTIPVVMILYLVRSGLEEIGWRAIFDFSCLLCYATSVLGESLT